MTWGRVATGLERRGRPSYRRWMTSDIPTVVSKGSMSLSPGSTPGIQRFTAFDDEGVWVGTAETRGGEASAWHVHPGHDTYVYVLSARIRIEHGPGGADAVEAVPGEFLKIPRGVVHREGNPSPDDGEVVVVRIGSGPLVENVEGPEPPA